MERMILTSVLITLMLFSNAAAAVDRLSIGAGATYRSYDLFGARLGLQWYWPSPLWSGYDWQITGYWEASYNALYTGDSPLDDGNTHLHIWAITPVFVLQTPSWHRWQPYVELAIGAAYFSDKEIAGRVTGSRYQFEDRAALGVRFGLQQQYDVNLRFLHYSNADIEEPNPGYDLLMLNFTMPITF